MNNLATNSPGSLPAHRDALASLRSSRQGIARMTESQRLAPLQLEERATINRLATSQREVDAFRELRMRLLGMFEGTNFIAMVAPVSRGSGGSFVARNLAAAVAFDESKSAVLVDCDLRNPSQHRTLQVDPERGGLMDVIEDPQRSVADALYETGVPRLRLMPAGNSRESVTEYFESFRMGLILYAMRARYPDRYIFLDGPPVLGSPDARILAGLADVVLLVAGYGHDTPAAIAQAGACFDPSKFAGVVFNEGV
jgi:Mrp family chromosome partitioning ATPase